MNNTKSHIVRHITEKNLNGEYVTFPVKGRIVERFWPYKIKYEVLSMHSTETLNHSNKKDNFILI